jgi:CCR4-NOT transcription complex subunit 10
MKACKREIKSALNLSNQSATALFLKSNFEFTRRNYRKAIKLLNSCPKSDPHLSGQSLAVMYYNNLATVHFQVGR